MITRKEEIKGGAWCVYDLLDRQECQQIIDTALEAGIEDNVAQGDQRHRNHNKHAFESKELAQTLWGRLKNVVPQDYHLLDASAPPEGFQEESLRDMIGHWQPSAINTHFAILYYKTGGHFGPHRDRYKITSDHERSILTVAIYLTDRPAGHGGATHFVSDVMDVPVPDETGRIRAPESCIQVKVEADRAGKALIFQHDLMHEGELIQVQQQQSQQHHTSSSVSSSVEQTPSASPKWLLLTQVLYRRDPATAPTWTANQYEARRFLALAEKAEIEGDITGAIRLYTRAYKLDPILETN